MKNTVSRFCSVAFVQKPQISHYTQYSSTNRLDALPSLADLERIIPSRLFLQPGQSFFSDAAEPRDFFSFPPHHSNQARRTSSLTPFPSDNPMASNPIPQSW